MLEKLGGTCANPEVHSVLPEVHMIETEVHRREHRSSQISDRSSHTNSQKNITFQTNALDSKVKTSYSIQKYNVDYEQNSNRRTYVTGNCIHRLRDAVYVSLYEPNWESLVKS